MGHPEVVSFSFMAQKCKQIVDFSPQKCLAEFNLISPWLIVVKKKRALTHRVSGSVSPWISQAADVKSEFIIRDSKGNSHRIIADYGRHGGPCRKSSTPYPWLHNP